MRDMGWEAFLLDFGITKMIGDRETPWSLLRGPAGDGCDQVWLIREFYPPLENVDVFPAALSDWYSRIDLS